MDLVNLVPINSTSYVDMLGLSVGLDRSPGELAVDYYKRLLRAVSGDRRADYSGILNQIGLELGLDPSWSFTVSSSQTFDLKVSFGKLVLDTHTISLLAFTSDDFWSWKQISAVVAEINALGDYQAVLVGNDGPSVCLNRQANSALVTAEAIQGTTVTLQHGDLLSGTETFSVAVPGYTLGEDQKTLRFASPVPDGCTITYRFRTCPFTLVTSPVAMFSLTDEDVKACSLGSNGKPIYQVREYVQEIAKRDRSYWGT